MHDRENEFTYLTHLLKSCLKSADSLALKLAAIKICEAIEIVETADAEKERREDAVHLKANIQHP